MSEEAFEDYESSSCEDKIWNWKFPVSLLTILCNAVASIGCFYFIAAILARPSTRKNTFNIYVVFLVFPDALGTLATAIFASFKICGADAVPNILWNAFDWVGFFYYSSNFWLNCCIAWELYRTVEGSHRLRRRGPPALTRVAGQVGAAYAWSIWFGTWALLDVPWSFYDTESQAFGSPDDGIFSELGAVAFCGALTILPILFVVGIRIRIWHKNLLAPLASSHFNTDQNTNTSKTYNRRTRILYRFFERIVAVFVVLYVPGVALTMFAANEGRGNAGFWMERAIDVIKASQAAITLYICALKQDIRAALSCGGTVACCGCGIETADRDLERCSEKDRSSMATVTPTAFLSDSLTRPSSSTVRSSGWFSGSIAASFATTTTAPNGRSESIRTAAAAATEAATFAVDTDTAKAQDETPPPPEATVPLPSTDGVEPARADDDEIEGEEA